MFFRQFVYCLLLLLVLVVIIAKKTSIHFGSLDELAQQLGPTPLLEQRVTPAKAGSVGTIGLFTFQGRCVMATMSNNSNNVRFHLHNSSSCDFLSTLTAASSLLLVSYDGRTPPKVFQGTRSKIPPSPHFVRVFNIRDNVFIMFQNSISVFDKIRWPNPNVVVFAQLRFSKGVFSFHEQDIFTLDLSGAPNDCAEWKQGWTPVPNDLVKSAHHPHFALVCSIYPHRIMTFDFNDTTMRTMRLLLNLSDIKRSHSVLSHEQGAEYYIQQFWPFGKINHPATEPLLIDTPVGQKYVSFFSSFWDAGSTIYGAYFFDISMPYRITHFARQPTVLTTTNTSENLALSESILTGCVVVDAKFITCHVENGLQQPYFFSMSKTTLWDSCFAVQSEALQELYVLQTHRTLSPLYHMAHAQLMKIRRKQYDKALWLGAEYIDGTVRNPAIVLLSTNGSSVLVSCHPRPDVYFGVFLCSYELYHQLEFSLVPALRMQGRDIIFVENATDGLWADDMRLIRVGMKLYGIFNRLRPKHGRVKRKFKYHFDSYITELVITQKRMSAKYITFLNGTSIAGKDFPEKNWSPFICPNQDDGLLNVCFVYEIFPHIIVSMKSIVSMGSKEYEATVKTLAISSFVNESQFWQYGTPRGGTPAHLVKSVFGTRFLAFFHSSKENANRIKTYYAGAYLFRDNHPFDITHFSTEPLVEKSLYNISQTWTHRGMDFVVFPMSYILRNDVVFLTLGVQDRGGLIVALNFTILCRSLKPTTTTTGTRSRKTSPHA